MATRSSTCRIVCAKSAANCGPGLPRAPTSMSAATPSGWPRMSSAPWSISLPSSAPEPPTRPSVLSVNSRRKGDSSRTFTNSGFQPAQIDLNKILGLVRRRGIFLSKPCAPERPYHYFGGYLETGRKRYSICSPCRVGDRSCANYRRKPACTYTHARPAVPAPACIPPRSTARSRSLPPSYSAHSRFTHSEILLQTSRPDLTGPHLVRVFL